MIDSHCHLAAKEFSADLKDVIARAKTAGVDRMIVIADTMEEGRRGIEIAAAHPGLFCTLGVHPHHAKDWQTEFSNEIRQSVRSPNNIVAIGEIGLDYHYNFSDPEKQRAVFREQLMLAKELTLPSVVHCREAVSDLWRIVNEVKPPRLVVHCCTERFEDVKPFVDRGDLLSFTGIATYPNAQIVRDTIAACPLDQLMIETDAPYLSPVPHRGKRNEPAFVTEVAKTVATIKGVSLDEIDRVTTANAVAFFRLPS